jgi:hypothetical protein
VFKTKKKTNHTPIPKGFYAWTSLYAGSFLLFTEELNDCYQFIFLPGPSYMHLTPETFEKCISTKVLEFVETVPDDVFQETVTLAKNNVVLSNKKAEDYSDEKHTNKNDSKH